MSELDTWIIGLSLAVAAILSGCWFYNDRHIVRLLLRLSALAMAYAILRWLFDFPRSEQAKSGGGWEDASPIIGLYIAMVMGMCAQYGYAHFSQLKRTRQKFDFGVFIAPVFLSPIVFIPLFETLKSQHVSLQASFMSLLIAFENGFFFKSYLDHERLKREKTVHS